jgi:hypothetical protein
VQCGSLRLSIEGYGVESGRVEVKGLELKGYEVKSNAFFSSNGEKGGSLWWSTEEWNRELRIRNKMTCFATE